ncbi:MAG: 4Fe-4S binding protein [Armatimonadetes bacterium]|nr:4Fe-4S binding protein [Armatimonadota bacterium]MDW8121943.1 4Fe-4S binding protein [Armatimonadota bacterium]
MELKPQIKVPPVRPSLWQDLQDAVVTLGKALWVTLKNLGRSVLLRQAVTITEPWGSRPIPLRYRGTIGLTYDRRTGKENCIGCLACERICPDHCIHIEVEDEKEGHKGKYPTVFIIDNNLCSLCGLCVEVCPVPALIHTSVWQVGGYSHKDLVFEKPMLYKVGEWQQDQWIKMGLGTVDVVTGKKSMQMTDEEWRAEEEKKKAAAAARAQRAAAARATAEGRQTPAQREHRPRPHSPSPSEPKET